MAINETIVIGRKFRKCIDPVNKIWQRFSLWTKSPDVEFEDGKDAETKLGMINGITSDLNCEDESIAISASAVRDLSAKFHPINSVYMSFSPTNPAELFGGTWEQIEGRFLLAACEEYPVDSIGGEPTHKLTVSEMPKHNHTYVKVYSENNAVHSVNGGTYGNVRDTTVMTSYAGGDQPHNNMPPYLAVYMWRRVG